MKTLMVDLETSPNLAYVWGLWDQNVGLSQIDSATEMLCFAAKWLGKRGAGEFYSGDLDPRGGNTENMVLRAHELLSEADVVMHYNGRTFDVPHLNREFLALGLTPPAPFQQIDLYQAVRKRFKFPSNKLEYVAKALQIGGKVKHEGFDLWLKCMAGDEGAWKRMEKYNRQDVVLLEKAYAQLQPWIPSHPSHGAHTGEDVCPACGGSNLISEGYALTAQGKYRRFRCKDCGKWSRSTKRIAGTSIREVVL